MNRTELQEHVTGLIIAQLEQGNVPWSKGWSSHGFMASNLVSGKSYRGINALILSMLGEEYEHGLWLTYKQAQALGGQVIKGSKGTHIVYYSPITKKDDLGEISAKFSLMKSYTVFNIAQCEGITIPAKYLVQGEPVEILPAIEAMKAGYMNCPPVYYKEQDRAYYSPSEDSITLPSLAQFTSASEHAYTLAHELVHSTGHESRCNRWDDEADKPTKGHKDSYAREELVAELGACMLLSSLGLEVDIVNSGAYIKSWLSALKNDTTLIFSASGKASKAIECILGAEVREEVSA